MTSLSPFLRRVLALSLLAALLLFVFSGLVQPLLEEYDGARDSVVRLSAALERARRSRPDIAELRAELARLKASQPAAAGFLRSANESLAAAELQSRLKSAVEAVHGELRSTQALLPRDEGIARRVAIRGQIEVDLAALQRVFHDLEAASPFLFIDNVEIHTRPPTPLHSLLSDDPTLEVRFDLSGYMRRAT